jgi:hypothetical protein
MFRRGILLRPRRRYHPPHVCMMYLPLREMSIGTSPNLLVNGDFDEGITCWSAVTGTAIASEETITYAGGKSLKVSITSAGTYRAAQLTSATPGAFDKAVTALRGLTLTLSGYAYSPLTNTLAETKLYLGDSDGSTYENAFSDPIAKNDVWYSIAVSKKIRANATSILIKPHVNAGTSDADDVAYFDELTLTVPQMVAPNGLICHPEGCIWTPEGFYFDGAYNLITFESDFIGVNACTVMGWINVTLGANRWILDNGKFAFYVMGSSKCLGATSNGLSTQKYSAENSITEGKNTHVAVTRDATGLVNFYINGQPSGTPEQESGTPAAGTTNVVAGNRLAGDRPYSGLMDELLVFNRVLSHTEIQSHYDMTKWSHG